MKKIFITNKDKTQILTVDSEGDFDFVEINEELLIERAGLFYFEENSRNIIRICKSSNDKILYDSRNINNDNIQEISYSELLNILIVNG